MSNTKLTDPVLVYGLVFIWFVCMLVRLRSLKNEVVGVFRRVRWGDGVRCPKCGCARVWGIGRYRDSKKQVWRRYLCKGCNRSFNDKTKTFLHYSRLSLLDFVTLFLISFYLGLPFMRSSYSLEMGYGTVYRMSRRILSVVSSRSDGSKLSGVVELDETYVTAGLKGRGYSGLIRSLGRKPRRRGLSRRGRGNYYGDRVPVMVGVSRGGGERYAALRTMSSEEVEKAVGKLVERGSKVYSDEYKSYNVLDKAGYTHETVNHSRGEYARGEVHINNCENRAGLLKRFLRPRNGVNKNNLEAYIRLYQYHKRISRLSLREAIMEAIRV